MPNHVPTFPGHSRRKRLIQAMLIGLALIFGSGRVIAAPGDPVVATPKKGVDQTSWFRSGAIFLVASTICAIAWYLGLFPALLRKGTPSWPLDAWRYSTYGAWITTCVSAYAFKGPMIAKVIEPMLGSKSSLTAYFMEMVLLPLLALVGLLVIWNFRRDTAGRVRPT